MSTRGMRVAINGHEFNVEHVVEIDYTNYRGERAKRLIVPRQVPLVLDALLRFDETEYHTPAQFIIDAFDIRKGAERTFAMNGVHGWRGLNAAEAFRELRKIADAAGDTGV